MLSAFPSKSLILPSLLIAASAIAGCASPGAVATEHGDAVQLQQILDQPNHGNENLGMLLFFSSYYDCPQCEEMLLKLGVKPSADLLAGDALAGRERSARLLISYGAEPTAAMAAIEANPYSAFTGAGNKPEQIQSARSFFDKIAREPASNPSVAAAPAEETAKPGAPAAEPMRLRASPLFHDAERPNDYALVVGIEKYDSLPAATYADRDAAAAADFVEAMGVPAANVVTLTDEHATRGGLAKKLEGWLANNVNADSTVYFYYSGHGAPDTKTGQAYLVPFDGDPEYLDQTAYPLKRLYEKLGALKAKRVIVMLDSCFSGAGGRSVLAKGARPLVSNVDTGVQTAAGKITVLAAAGAEQISGTYDEKGHGLFSYYLFNGLNGAAKDASGEVTVKSLFAYVKPKVEDDAHRDNRDQVPHLRAGAAGGDVVLREK